MNIARRNPAGVWNVYNKDDQSSSGCLFRSKSWKEVKHLFQGVEFGGIDHNVGPCGLGVDVESDIKKEPEE